MSKGFIKFDIKIIEGPADQLFFVGLYGTPVGDGRSTGWVPFQVGVENEWVTLAFPLEDFLNPTASTYGINGLPFSGDLTEIIYPFMLTHWGGLHEPVVITGKRSNY